MAIESPTRSNGRWNRILLLLASGFDLAAWAVVMAGEQQVSQLDLSRWGTDLDIPERLAIDKYLSRHFLPYIRTALLLDALAYAMLCWAGKRGRFGMLGVIVGILWLVSAGWHGFYWLVTSFFATEAVRF